MPQQVTSSVTNNFTKGLITEFTGLNFPENAATDTDNCLYNLVGDVERRLGFDYENNFAINSISTVPSGITTYKWNNAGGDGNVQLLVVYTGGSLFFWNITNATETFPLSNQKLTTNVFLGSFVAVGGAFDNTLECQFSDGNGYLFVTHPSCDPIYCTYVSGVVTGFAITIQTRDFTGAIDGLSTTVRPAGLSAEHQYNLMNQGWTVGNPWQTNSSSTNTVGFGPKSWVVATGLPISSGQNVQVSALDPHNGIPYGMPVMSITVTSYSGSTLVGNVTGINPPFLGYIAASWLFLPYSVSTIITWQAQVGNYPSNSDVWWYFKDGSGNFSPGTTVSNTVLAQSPAPRGHFILNEFSQQRGTETGLPISQIATAKRPRTTTWFSGRVWYAGTDAQQAAFNNVPYYSWTENIYFSQIVQTTDDFGHCYQTNDRTSENLFDLLPTDGGVIHIQGCGSIYKLFAIANGLLVFASNGIWFITGSQGIGFTANDYTITKISSVQSISGTSFVDVFGLPYFWNEEGIYSVSPTQGSGGQLQVEAITLGTILSFYNNIPLMSKKYVKAAFHPVNYNIQWIYRDTNETGISDRYTYNRVLNYNTYNKAFFPYTLSPGATVSGVNYVAGPGGRGSENPSFKYFTLAKTGTTFSEEWDTDHVDWTSAGTPTDYNSYFITGYKLRGQALHKFEMPYVYTYTKNDAEETPTAFKIQGIWDYARSGDSGRWSSEQLVTNFNPNFGVIYRRHRLRGRGMALQIKISSFDSKPFHIIGWSTYDTVNQGL